MIELTALVENHYSNFKKYVCNPHVAEYLTWEVYTSPSVVRLFFENVQTKTQFPNEFLAILLDGNLIGTAHIIRRGEGVTQIGWGILPQYRNQGYGEESFKMLIDYIKQTERHKTTSIIWADSHVDNVFAIKIIKKYGFVEGEIMGNRQRHIYIISKNYD